MEAKDADFSGWATKAGLKCSDGRVILKGAFAHQDGSTVPVVWQHKHDDVTAVLGHAILENRDEGVYAHVFLNDSASGKHAKTLVQHGDIVSLSIFANGLKETVERSGKMVSHGNIRELSLVLAGANPGAFIENVRLAHSDDPNDVVMLEDEAYISMGAAADVTLEHAASSTDGTAPPTDGTPPSQDTSGGGKTLADVLDTFNDEQRQALDYVVGAAIEEERANSTQHSDTDADADSESTEGTDSAETDGEESGEGEDSTDSTTSEDNGSDDNNNGGGAATHSQEGTDTIMSRNVFDQTDAAAGTRRRGTLTHTEYAALIQDAQRLGSFKAALIQHSDAIIANHKDELAHATNSDGSEATYGFADIDWLFPQARLEGGLSIHSRRMEWVQVVLDGTKKLPFSRVRTLIADITDDEARAKGYVTGARKKDEVIKLLRRSTGPATIYKKQKLDRDDVIDIGNDIDIISWLKVEIRLMLEEELARAILVGDGRPVNHEDKIKDPAGDVNGDGIRSILHDDDFYSIKAALTPNVSPKDAVKDMVRARTKYRGSGKPTLFISHNFLTEIMLEEDKFGRPLYETEQVLTDKLRVDSIVSIDLFSEYEDVVAILVNLADYSIGTNQGGELTSFEFFDIDFNQHKYLQETRLSGGLNKPLSAVVVTLAQGTAVTVVAPSFDGATNTITLPNTAGVLWELNGTATTPGDHVITDVTEVEALTDETHYIPAGTTRTWTFTP